MLSLTHAAIGGAIGEQLGNPYFAFGLALISHILLDKVPHFFSFKKPLKQIIIYGDTIATTLFLIFLWFLPTKNHTELMLGAFGGVLIDLCLVLIAQEKGKIAAWHTNRQIHKDSPIWLLTDLTLFILGLALIIIFK
jgi:hypothetical protein